MNAKSSPVIVGDLVVWKRLAPNISCGLWHATLKSDDQWVWMTKDYEFLNNPVGLVIDVIEVKMSDGDDWVLYSVLCSDGVFHVSPDYLVRDC